MPFKTNSGKLLYRVGDVIISTNGQNPSEWYGGTWELFAPGRTLVCIDTSQSEFDSIKKTGGSKYMQQHNHGGTISDGGWHTHTGSASGGDHRHTLPYVGYRFDSIPGQTNQLAKVEVNNPSHLDIAGTGNHSHTLSINGNGTHSHGLSVSNSGSGNAQNLQPYMVVYMWIRVA